MLHSIGWEIQEPHRWWVVVLCENTHTHRERQQQHQGNLLLLLLRLLLFCSLTKRSLPHRFRSSTTPSNVPLYYIFVSPWKRTLYTTGERGQQKHHQQCLICREVGVITKCYKKTEKERKTNRQRESNDTKVVLVVEIHQEW